MIRKSVAEFLLQSFRRARWSFVATRSRLCDGMVKAMAFRLQYRQVQGHKNRSPKKNEYYTLNGNVLQKVDEEKDLGIFVTGDLKPSVHCAKAAAKAMQVLGLGVIKRNFVLTDEEDFRLLFNGVVRPHLE